MPDEKQHFILPDSITGPPEISRLQRELEALADFMGQAKIRKSDDAKLPAPSKFLSELCSQNHLNLLHEADRDHLKKALDGLKTTAPVIHISFAVDPTAAFMEKLIKWLRDQVHPYLLVTVGLQPNLSAGCIVRTNNKIFDFSLREHFKKNGELLLGQLSEIPIGAANG